MQGASSVFVKGNYAFVTSTWDDDALTIVDVTDHSTPVLVKEIDKTVAGFSRLDQANSVFVSGSYAFVTALAHPIPFS